MICSGADGSTLTAVMDGVGGWSLVGVDPAKYSNALAKRVAVQFMEWAERHSTQSVQRSEAEKPLLGILERAYAQVLII